ncbi:hypothetical protein JTE90_018238 [Oedothorax gibbosus]|uniref:DDE Tnp4 domain-containing protein n=1 Tax=Oedothorax gibbosus TaxID=931172 RepID=A0AAV6UAQ2_9ARAC|nr:hypothetical protein JTE90_018238 [Oedothorax gibbosus]
MSASDLETLLRMIGPSIEKKATSMRDPISSKERLVVTLRFLASGDSYHSLMYAFRIPVCTISRIVQEVCAALYERGKGEFLKTPSEEEEWKTVAKQFQDTWNFPHCLGALDGKHVVMQAPKNCGSLYFNYKGSHSIVLMAVADAEYRFLYCNIGCNGRVADGGVFGNSSMASSLEAGTMSLPAASPLPGRELNTPYVFVADDAFALKTYMMKPYPHKNQPALNRVFNYRLSRARRVVENAFGIMANRFRVLRRPFNLQPKATTTVVSAICILHNYLLRSSHYADVSDHEDSAHSIENGSWREEGMPEANLLPIEPAIGHNHSLSAKSVREELKEYFVSTEGEVEWQYKFI